MRESTASKAILEEGRIEGETQWRLADARRNVLELGTEKSGPANSTTATTIERLEDLDRLHRLMRGVLRVSSWQELHALASER